MSDTPVRIFKQEQADEPGFYRMSDTTYHADPCVNGPSLSRSLALTLLDQSPAHAWAQHPKLNPKFEEKEPDNQRLVDRGSAAHVMLLNQPTKIVTILADDYRKKGAKEERDAARAKGAIPLLEQDRETVENMIEAAMRQLKAIDHPVARSLDGDFADGGAAYNELTAVWRDVVNDRWCRIRMDRMHLTERRISILDYKTTSQSAAHHSVGRMMCNNDYHFQEAFYRRGIEQLIPLARDGQIRLDFTFLVQEQDPPYALSLVEFDTAARIIGRKRVSAAIRLWDKCMTGDVWPAYSPEPVIAELPAYLETQWTEREITDPSLSNLPIDPFLEAHERNWRSPEIAGPC